MQTPIVHTCANGLSLLILPSRRARVVSVRVGVETGSAREGELSGTGVSHLVEHMVFKGTAEFSAEQLNEKVADWGGIWNAYTGTDSTIFHIDGCAEQWRNFLHILLQLTFRPSFPRDEWELERDVIRREMEMYDDDPDDFAYKLLTRTLYRIHPRRFPVIGERSRFDALTYDDMVRYHARRYVPGNMFICVVGDVDAQEVIKAAEEELSSVPPAYCALAQPPMEPRQWGHRVVRREFAQSTSSLILAWRVPDANHEDMPALSLLASILGSGRTAWLFRRFHDESHIAYEIGAQLLAHSQGENAFAIDAEVDTDRRDKLRRDLLNYVRLLPQQDFTSALQRSLHHVRLQHWRDSLSVSSMAELLCSFWTLSHNPGAYDEWVQALSRVTSEDVRRVAARYLVPDAITEITIDPIGSRRTKKSKPDGARISKPVVHRLSNGLRCVLRVDTSVPLLHASLAVTGGCRVENVSTAGISSVLAECMPKGTSSRSIAQIAEELENRGATLNASTGNNTIVLNLRCMTEDADALLALMAEVAARPSFPEEVVEATLGDQMIEMQEELLTPTALAQRELRSLCYGPVSYGLPPSGFMESLATMTRADLVRMHKRLFCARNAVLSVVGDFEPNALLQRLESFFGVLPEGRPIKGIATPPMQTGELRVRTPQPVQQAVLVLALPSLPIFHPLHPHLLIFADWCSDMSGPLYAELRERQGLVYHVSASVLHGVDAGALIFELETSPAQLKRAGAALNQVLRKIARTGMSAAQLARIQAMVLSSSRLSEQSPGKMAASSAINELLGLGADYAEQISEAVQHASLEEMQSLIHLLLASPAARARVSVLSPDA